MSASRVDAVSHHVHCAVGIGGDVNTHYTSVLLRLCGGGTCTHYDGGYLPPGHL